MPITPVRQRLDDPKTVAFVLGARDRATIDTLAQQLRCSRGEVVRLLIARYGQKLATSPESTR